MATNYIQPGDVLTIPAPAAVASGGVVIAGEIVGVALGAAESGAPADVSLVGVFELPKVSTDVAALGAAIYWDAGAGLATVDDASGANPRLGVAVAAAGNGAATVKVRLG